MLQPIKTKFRKAHKGRIKGVASSGATLAFGEYGLKALEPERVTARQIEAARRALTRHMKRAGRVWIRVFPDVPVTQEAARSAHGLGQGRRRVLGGPRSSPAASCSSSTACPVQLAKEALALAAAKLPIKTRFVQRIAE